jgi:predicted AlkP superfamily phosphohydrolase/phosphomutase
MSRVLVVGLDALDPDLVEAWLPDLPNLRRLVRSGIHGRLRSIVQPVTPAAWTSAISGRNPGHFGFTDFLYRTRPGPGPGRLVHSGAILAPTLYDFLRPWGLRLTMVGVPVSYPPVQGEHVTCVSCFMAPSIDRAITSPAELQPEVLAATPAPYLLDVTAEDGLADAGRRELAGRLLTYDHQRFDVTRLLARRPWDLLFMVCMGTDRVGHYFVRDQDAEHVQHVPGSRCADTMREHYRACDTRLGELLEEVGPDVAVMVLSDHGMQRCDGHVFLNEWLLRNGYLHLERPVDGPTPLAKAAVHWGRTRAWAGGYGGQVHLNLRGRHQDGCVDPVEADGLVREIAQGLSELRRPDGSPLPVVAFPGREVFDGPHADRCPDLCVQFDGLRHLSADRLGAPDVVCRLGADRVDGGSHAADGFLALAGPGVPAAGRFESMHLLDVAPTILDLLGLPERELDGRAIHRTAADDAGDDPYSGDDELALTNRLRKLYLE